MPPGISAITNARRNHPAPIPKNSANPPPPPTPPPIQRLPRERRRERPDDVLMAASQGDSTTDHRSPRLAGVLSLSKDASQNRHLSDHAAALRQAQRAGASNHSGILRLRP